MSRDVTEALNHFSLDKNLFKYFLILKLHYLSFNCELLSSLFFFDNIPVSDKYFVSVFFPFSEYPFTF